MATGRIEVDEARCKGCEICWSVCPQQVIDFADHLNAKGYRPVYLNDPTHQCTGCALCAVVCPDGCITVYKNVPPPRTARLVQEEMSYG